LMSCKGNIDVKISAPKRIWKLSSLVFSSIISCRHEDKSKLFQLKLREDGYQLHQEVIPEIRICHRCCEPQHKGTECKSGKRCFTCHDPNHTFKRCPQRDSHSIICKYCKSSDHRSYACPKIRTSHRMFFPDHVTKANPLPHQSQPVAHQSPSRKSYVQATTAADTDRYVNEIKQLQKQVMELTIQLKEMAAQYKALENSHAMYILKTNNANVTSDTFIRDDYEKDNNDNHSSGNDDSSGWQLQKCFTSCYL
jgi:hypothetical protein